MNKKHITIIICLAIILLTACSPSAEAIQTAIAETQAAWTQTYTATFTPQPTSTPTRTPIPPTQVPAMTTYALEIGFVC